MSTEDINMVTQVLAGILNPDATIRTKAAEKILELSQNLGAVTFCLLQVSALPSETPEMLQIKETSLVLLRKIISKENLNKWVEIQPNLKEEIKNKAISNLSQEKNQRLKNKLTDVFTEIIIKINDAEEDWPALKQLCINLIQQNVLQTEEMSNIECVLRIFRDSTGFIFDTLTEKMQNFIQFFTQIFASPHMKLKVIASECIHEVISFANETKDFQPFIFNILQTALECFKNGDEDNLKSILEIIIEISSVEPEMIAKHFKDLFELCMQIIDKKDYSDEKIRELGFEVLINLIEEKPKIITKEKEKDNFVRLIEKLYQYGLEFDKSDDNAWCNPTTLDYEKIENMEEENISFSQGMIDRLVECTGVQKISPLLYDIINKLISQNDWSYKYIALFSLSSLAQYEDDMSSLEITFNLIFSLTKHEHYKVRYAAVNCINKFTVTFNPDFIKKYHQQTLPLLVDLFKKETILRNQCEIMETIDGIIGFIQSEQLKPYMADFFEFLYALFNKDLPIILKKCVVETILELVCTMEDDCAPFAPNSFQMTIKYFSQIYQTKTNSVLYGPLIEIITSLGPLAKEAFNPVIPDILKTIIEITQESNFANMPSKLDFQNSIEKLVPILEENYQDLLPQLVQAVFSLIKHTPKMSISSSPEDQLDINSILSKEDGSSRKIDLGTSDIEDFASSLSLLNSIIEKLEDKFLPYAEETEKNVLPFLSYPLNAKIRSKVAKILPNLVKIIKDNDVKKEKGKRYISAIIAQIEKETEYKICNKMYADLQNILEAFEYIFNQVELNSLFEKLLKHFSVVEGKRKDFIKKKENPVARQSNDDDEDDDDIGDLIDEDIEALEGVEEEISETIGCALKTHKNLSKDIVTALTTKVIPQYTSANASDFEFKMALFIVDDLIEFLGQELLNNIWDDLFKLIINFSTSKTDNIRQAACYGIGIFSQFTKNNFNKYSEQILLSLKEAMKINPTDQEDEESWGLAHDNIISSFGKILLFQGEDETVKKYMSEIVQVWITNLPIKNDTAEQEQQHELLADFVMEKSNLIPSNCLVSAFKAMASVYMSKMSNQTINEKIEKVFAKAKGDEQGKSIIDQVYQNSEDKIKNKLKQLIA